MGEEPAEVALSGEDMSTAKDGGGGGKEVLVLLLSTAGSVS